MWHFSHWLISLLMPVTYHARSFFSVVYHFEVCHSYSSSYLNLGIHWFTVDFMITFYTRYTAHILMWISLPKNFLAIKTNKILLLILGHNRRCYCYHYFSHHCVIFNRLLQNFTCELGIPSGTRICSFSATVLPHADNGWVMQNFRSTPL